MSARRKNSSGGGAFRRAPKPVAKAPMRRQRRRDASLSPLKRRVMLDERLRRGDATPAELATALGVTPRQVARLLAEIRQDYGLDVTTDGNGRVRYVNPNARAPFGWPFNAYQSAMLQFLAETVVADRKLSEKFSWIISGMAGRGGPWDGRPVLRRSPRPKSRPESAEMIETWWDAYAGRHPVRFEYVNKHSGRFETREVEPAGIGFVEGMFELDGWDRGKKDWRSFRTQRMRSLKVLPEELQRRRSWDPDEIFRGAFRRKRGSGDHRVVVRVGADVAYRVSEVQHHPSQRVLRDVPGGGVEVEFRLSLLDEVLEWALSMGPSCLVLEPPELVAMARERTRAMATSYEVPK